MVGKFYFKMQQGLDLSSSRSLLLLVSPPQHAPTHHSPHLPLWLTRFCRLPEASWLWFALGQAHKLWYSKFDVIIKCHREKIFPLLYWSLNFTGRNSYSNKEAIITYLLSLQKRAHLEIYILRYKQVQRACLGCVCVCVYINRQANYRETQRQGQHPGLQKSAIESIRSTLTPQTTRSPTFLSSRQISRKKCGLKKKSKDTLFNSLWF